MAVLTSSAALEQFLTEVRRLAPQARLLLFGSQARQQATPDSDYDLLIILPQADPALKEVRSGAERPAACGRGDLDLGFCDERSRTRAAAL